MAQAPASVGYRHVGRLVQIAFVVADLDEGIAHWAGRMNVGPFAKFTDVAIDQADYRGAAAALAFEAAIAWSGDLMVELVRPLGPSIFDEYLRDGNIGLHHLAYAVDDFDAAHAELIDHGGVRVQGARFADGTRNAYFAMPGNAAFVEIGALSPALSDVLAQLKHAAADWDSASPVVALPAPS